MQGTVGMLQGNRSRLKQVPTGHIQDSMNIKINDGNGLTKVKKKKEERIHEAILTINNEMGDKRRVINVEGVTELGNWPLLRQSAP